MIVMTLDVRGTHVNNPDCPMRLAPLPNGRGWYCVDCGFEILQKRLMLTEPLQPTLDFRPGEIDGLVSRMGGVLKPCHGRPPICTTEPQEVSRIGNVVMLKQGSDVWLEEID